MDIRALRDELRLPGTRVGVGVWLIPRAYLGQEESIAAKLGAQALDARLAYLESLPVGARFSGLTRQEGSQNLVALLYQIARSIHERDCLLVHNLDLLLLGLEVGERDRFWREVLEGLPYPRTRLILCIPEKAPELLSFEVHNRYTAQIAEGALS